MVALPFVANEFGVLQLVMIWPILFGLDALLRYFAAPDWWPAAQVGVWIAVAFLTSEYYAFFLLVASAIVTVVMIVRRRVRAVQLAHAALALGLVVVLAGPFFVSQSSRITEFSWPVATVAGLGASAGDWFRLNASAWGSEVPLIGAAPGTALALYPGTVVLVLAYFGLAGTRRRHLRAVVALCVLALAFTLLAFGLGLELAGWSPYAFLRDHVPGSLRSHPQPVPVRGRHPDLHRARRRAGPRRVLPLVEALGCGARDRAHCDRDRRGRATAAAHRAGHTR